MRILIEEYQYEYNDVKKVLSGLGVLQDVEGKVSLNYVGYYYSPEVEDCVFILPKVLLEDKDNKELAFGHIEPSKLIDAENCGELTKEEHDFIYGLAVWIYRAICVYKDAHPETGIVFHKQAPEMGNREKRRSNTFLDILLTLMQFNKDNKDFFFFILRNIHSGFNKINWTRTISHSTAYIQNGKPFYLNPVNKKRKINFDEELLIIYFSILQYINEEYGFPVDIDVNYELISGKKFVHYLKGYGKIRLKQIKYKYFSDKALALWELCYAFFDHPHMINVNIDRKEYLLVKSFNIVFEAIIDELVGDRKSLPTELIEQQDGKRVDHMFRYDSLIEKREKAETKDLVYYIGDSKYYKRKTPIGATSIAKQFTYARNVIQWNMDLFMDNSRKEEQKNHIRLRDEVTEGYNIIPNFFISARQDTLKADSKVVPVDDSNNKLKDYSRQFDNRLFDRDTLLLAHYDVNFLYVVQLYGRNNRSQKTHWQQEVRNKFRDKIREMLEERYKFYFMVARENINPETTLKDNFQQIIGKVFSPYPDNEEGHHFYSLALEDEDKIKDVVYKDKVIAENKNVKKLLEPYFIIEEVQLGEDPRERITLDYAPCDGRIQRDSQVLVVAKTGLNYNGFLSAIAQTKKVGIALQGDSGTILKLAEGFTSASILLVTDKNHGELFWLEKGPYLEPNPQKGSMAMTKGGEALYLVYNVDTSIKTYVVDINYEQVRKLYSTNDNHRNYDSHMVTMEYLTKKTK